MRFGDEDPNDGQFNQIKAWAEPYAGPPVTCEVCRRRGLEIRAEVTVVTDADEGLFVAACQPCARSMNVGTLVQVSENREVSR